jgi:N-acetylmuramoyl-L-alanine amidase
VYKGVYEESLMDERVLKGVTVLMGILTIVVCVGMYFFPELHELTVFAAEPNTVSVSTDVVDTVESDGKSEAQLQIELPEELDESEITIENEYISQTIYIRFAGGTDDYFDKYDIRGSSDHIASLSYYKDGEEGVIALNLDRVYELEQEYEPGLLSLNFTDPHDIYDKVVVIDAGHGGRAPGAVKLGVEEKDIDLSIVLRIKELFDDEEDSIGVYYTRTTDTNPTLKQRVGLANKSDADLFISIHNNAESNGNFSNLKGTQVLFSESDASELSSKVLAQICLEEVTDKLGSRAARLLEGDDIYIIRNSDVPVALIEVGFMTNYDELKKLQTKKYQKAAAEGVYNAIKRAFQEGY